ncbi:aKG-HExxH-type peptide beta-hydroxylase [Mycolicibacterium tusciae]|uniref:aKG-HExxH-type peptide beta-hydroxylase n=1 Tax=Mycolicibacterium tusciae TaxID=75922 RepID=UPI001EF803AE|nr:HEXXH motif-containing putative peptide modification protein [Mycolicibacterium tusciae]
MAARIESVLAEAPQVLSYGAAYQWVTRLHHAIARDDTTLFDDLLADFSRFECAGAILSGGDFDGTTDDTKRLVVPLVGTFDLDTSRYQVLNGRLDAEPAGPPRVGGLRVDAHETTYRLARSMSQFNLDQLGHWRPAHEEITAARDIAELLVPGLLDRYLTDVVPLCRDGRISHAGTDEAAPFVVYSSFERDPVDLVACLAHEEAHGLINSADKIMGFKVLPDTDDKMPVPWKPGMMRSLSDVLHGLISFGRAAQVRTRAAAAGLGNPNNEEARLREIGWVTDVTAQLCAGILGPLPTWLQNWMQTNLGSWDTPVPQPTPGEVLARGEATQSMFPWLLWASDESRRTAINAYGELSVGNWVRGNGAFPDQDRTDVNLKAHPPIDAFVSSRLPNLIGNEFGDAVTLTAVKAHRIRRGDSIIAHSDDGGDEVAYRAVLGTSPLPTNGGLLRLCDAAQQPVVALPLRMGDCVVFNTERLGYHDVTELHSDSFRYTVVASYRRTANVR